MVWIAVMFAVIGLGAVVSGVIISRRSSQSLIKERLGLTDEDMAAQAGVPGGRRSPLGDALNRTLVRRGVGADLATQLAQADIKFTVSEFMAATVIMVIVATGLTFFLSGSALTAAGVCLLCFFAPRWYITFLRGRRLRSFNDQLSDTINLMVNGIRSGYSVMQSMESVSREMSPPISVEFARVVQEVQLGITLEIALSNMLRRMPSDDLDMMITAINVQREVGGNLAEVLDSISYTIRERVRIKGDIRALTSYGRGAGNLISAIPIILSVIVYLINPEFIGLLFIHRCGWMMIGAGVLGIVSGYIIIMKIVDIEV